MRVLPILALLALAGCGAAEEPPRAVQGVLRESLAEARRWMGPAAPDRPPPGMVRAVDISPDGEADWLIDYGKAGVAGWCGTGGCLTKILVSRPGGRFVTAFDSTAIEVVVSEARGERVIDLRLHGTHCDRAGAERCRRRFAWSEEAGRFEERVNADGRGRLETLFIPSRPDAAELPQAVKAAQAEAVARCRGAGAHVNEPGALILSSPDLNGDGRRDWIVDGEFAYCVRDEAIAPPPPRTQVFVTTMTGVAPAFSGENLAYDVDIATAPAKIVLVDVEKCAGPPRPDCEQVLSWNPAARRLQP